MKDIELTQTEITLKEFADLIIKTYRDRISEYRTGRLYNSINYNVVDAGGNMWRITISLEDYWKYIENGRKPGSKFPPISAIKSWINYRRIIPRPMILKSGKEKIPTIDQLSYLIARKIARDGIPARPFMEVSIKTARDNFINKLKISVQNDFLNFIKNK